ncbi:MAG: AAA family ATPase [Candidatus Woesearchaeota archaeon]
MEARVGLFLGKFAPFHKGHQYIVETALKEVDKLIVVIYGCPETTGIPLSVRAGWIRNLYPSVSVIEAADGPTEVGYTHRIKKMQEDYILKLLGDKKVTHFYSSEPYGEHMSIALDAKNRTIDLKREKVPVSGTRIRDNPYKNRQYVDPVVYKDMVANIVFMGGPSTGKTTIAEALAKKHNTLWMAEYGREYWDKNHVERRLTLKQLLEIAEGHIEREDELLLKSNRYLFTDTNAITTYLFSLYYHGKADSRLKKLAEECVSRYDFVFLCDTDIPYDDTWDRSGDVNRKDFQEQTIAYLREHNVSFITLSGDLMKRMKKVGSVLKGFKKC